MKAVTPPSRGVVPRHVEQVLVGQGVYQLLSPELGDIEQSRGYPGGEVVDREEPEEPESAPSVSIPRWS